jgi:hypothetical protein
MTTAALLILVAAICITATRWVMIDDLQDAENRADRASALARHYRQKYLDAITGVPVCNEADELWRAFLETDGRS